MSLSEPWRGAAEAAAARSPSSPPSAPSPAPATPNSRSASRRLIRLLIIPSSMLWPSLVCRVGRGATLPAVLIALLAVAGCGASTHASARPATTAGLGVTVPAAHHGRPAYRWLIATEGPQPPVAIENRHPGTGAWRLPGPAADVGGLAHGTVQGYVSEQSLLPGQRERIYVAAPGAGTVHIAIFRMGWYGGSGGREVLVSRPLRTSPQPPCVHRTSTGLTECHWHPTLSFTAPPALPSGVYIAKLTASTGESDCLFVVRARSAQPLIAQLPTSTYEAYNAWGGDSLYPGGSDPVLVTGTTQGVAVSYDRPYDSVTGAGEFFARDVAMVRFLERYGYPVSYTTSESVDQAPAQLLGHRAVIDFGHSEYWSARQARAFARARDTGTSLLFFSSDTLAWRIRYARASRRTARRASRITRSSPTRSTPRSTPTLLSSRDTFPTVGPRSPVPPIWAVSLRACISRDRRSTGSIAGHRRSH